MSSKEYVKMLSDSLDKKADLLRQLQGLNQEQKNILEDSESTPDMLDDNIEKKSDIIDRLDKMDDGFQSLYDKVKDDIGHYKLKDINLNIRFFYVISILRS